MPNSETSQRRLARVDRYVVLDVCLDKLPGNILHRLSLASKATKAKVKAAVQQRLPQLLQSAGAASAAAAAIDRLRNTDWPEPFPEEVAARRVMLWLLSTAGRHVLNRPAAADALMSIPHAYKQGTATAAVSCGFKPSYELILAAAKRQVRGVEEWARCMPAPRHLVPVLWNIVCLNRERLDDEEADLFSGMNNDPTWYSDLLTIAVNAKEPATAEALLDIMYSHDRAGMCSTDQAYQLLQTAILRSHRPLISSLIKLPAAAGLPHGQLRQLLRTAIAIEDEEAATAHSAAMAALQQGHVVLLGAPGVVQQLCESALVQQGISSAGALLPLLRLAVGQGNCHNAVEHLCHLSAAASHITAEQLMQLLQLGMQTGAANLQQLAAVSNALQELSAAAAEALLLQAVQQQGAAAVGVVQCLGGCPAVRQLSKGSVLQLVSTALRSSSVSAISGASNVQREAHAAEDSTPQLLRALLSGQMGLAFQGVLGAAGLLDAAMMALQSGQCGAATLLCRGDTARQIPLGEAIKLLQLAASTACSEADDRSVEHLVQCLASLQELEPQQLQELLAAAITSRCNSTVARLLQMPAVPLMSPDAACTLLNAAVTASNVPAVEMLCHLGAAMRIAPPAAAKLVLSALDSRQPEIAHVLCRQLQQIEGRTDVASELVQHLLRSALHPEQPEGAAAIDLLLELPAAEQLPAAQILQLLLAAVRMERDVLSSIVSVQVTHENNQSTVRLLCQLPGAWDIEEQGVLQLLHLVIEHQPLLLPYLLEMPPVQQLSTQAVLQLLQLTLAGAHTSAASSSCQSNSIASDRRLSCVQQLLQLVPWTHSEQSQQRLQSQNHHSPSISPARLAAPRWPCWRFPEESGAVDLALPAATATERRPQPAPAVQRGPSVQQLLQPEEAASLVKAALHSHDVRVLQELCRQLQQLRHLKSDAVRALVQEAVDVGSWDALRVMRSSLPGAVQVMQPGLVEGLLELRQLHGGTDT